MISRVDALTRFKPARQRWRKRIVQEHRRGSVDGYPQEQIRRPWETPPFNSGWQGPGDNFYLTGNRAIINNKSVDVTSPAFANIAVFDDLYQQNRMKILHGFGVEQTYYFAERHFQRVKVNANT